MNAVIRVEGLVPFQKALRDADRQFPVELRQGLNEAARVVADEARRRVPRRSGALAQSLRAQSTQREGRVVEGSARVPYAGWIEFGGRVGINKSVFRPLVREGRYMYPALVRERPKVERIAERVMNDVANKAGL